MFIFGSISIQSIPCHIYDLCCAPIQSRACATKLRLLTCQVTPPFSSSLFFTRHVCYCYCVAAVAVAVPLGVLILSPSLLNYSGSKLLYLFSRFGPFPISGTITHIGCALSLFLHSIHSSIHFQLCWYTLYTVWMALFFTSVIAQCQQTDARILRALAHSCAFNIENPTKWINQVEKWGK